MLLNLIIQAVPVVRRVTMSRQMLLFGETVKQSKNNEQQPDIRILALNLQSPSLERAKLQTEWLLNSDANIFLLTEATPHKGSYFLISEIESKGFKVFYSTSRDDKYFTAICVRGFNASDLDFKTKLMPSRIQGVRLNAMDREIRLIGMYAPTSWKNKPESYMKQRKEFHTQVLELLAVSNPNDNYIVGGDLNVLEPSHIPQVPGFEDPSFYIRFGDMGFVDSFREFYPSEKEYSWYSNERVGCRFDHFFVSKNLIKRVKKCNYDHDIRLKRLSDHSAMWLKLAHNLSQ